MAQNELVEQYLSEQYPEKYQSTDPDDKAYISRLRNRINESIGYFESKGITSPHEGNYLELNAWVSLKEGKPKGKPISPKTVKDWVSCTRNYYDWKEGEKQMLFKNEDISAQQAEIEPVSSEGVAVLEVSVLAESEGVSEAEGADHGASVQEVTTEEKDTAALSPVDTHSNEAVPVQEATIAPKPKNKGGRKILDPNGEKRSEKVMIYLRPSLYADVKDWANLHGKTITDCIVGMIEGYMQGKQEKLALFRELRDNE